MTIIDQPELETPPQHWPGERVATSGRLVGVEHEYVLRRGTERVDARRNVDLTRLANPALDPGDPNARRLAWGGVVTFDGPELEVVTPPLETRPGFATRVAADCSRGRRDVEDFLPDGVTLEGFSTHLNVSVTPGREITVAKRFIKAFSAAMMLLLDGADSPGILVRPRPGRLEIGGEFQDGTSLITALVFATGATRCCDVPRRQWNHSTRHELATLNPKIEQAVERFGWFIDRTAFGPDLYQDGRSATLPLRGGGTITAQNHLTESWHQAHLALTGDLDNTELDLVDDIIDGRFPLPSDTPQVATEQHTASGLTRSIKPTSTGFDLSPSPFGSLITPRVRRSLRLTAEVVTWGFVVFTLTDGTRTCHLTIPGTELETFLGHLDDGTLDTELRHRLDRPRRTKLARASQTGSVDAYRDLPNPAALLPPERDPGTGRFPRGSGGSGITGGRPGKRHQSERPPPTRPKWVRPVVIGAVVLIVIAAIAAALSTQGHDNPIFTATAPSTAPMAGTTDLTAPQADYGMWKSTAGNISLQRDGERLVGTVVSAAQEAGADGCQLRAGQVLFNVKADPPGNVGTVPSFPTDAPFIGSGTGTMQRLVTLPNRTIACTGGVVADVPVVLVIGREGSTTPGSSDTEPTLTIGDKPVMKASDSVDWFPFAYRFTRVSKNTILLPAQATPMPNSGS